jgi:hypothetical protein
MKRINCRELLGKLLLCSGIMLLSATASHAQSAADNLMAGAGGAYGDFDLSAQANTFDASGNVRSSGASGVYGRTGYKTNEAPGNNHFGNSQNTGKQLASLNGMGTLNLPLTAYVPLDKVFGGGRSLPKTTLDSFVRNAGGSADQIYGDEGSDGIPPFFGFDSGHRIEAGINSGQLTTGHRSNLPEAWGYPQ